MDKPSSEWTESDLLALIQNGVEERSDLEYKRAASLINTDAGKLEISKDISALANGAGGTIVYGMIEQNHKPHQLDGLDPAQITKEWLEHVINGRIRPRLASYHINPVPLANLAPGKVSYVISVQQSSTAHQAGDKRYYKRFNFESVPMEDYEIRDIMNRLKHPLIVPQFSRRFIDRQQAVHEYSVDIVLVNKGPMRARDLKLVVTVPRIVSKAVKGFDKQRLVKVQSALFGAEWFENPLTLINSVIFPEDELNITNGKDRSFIIAIDTVRFDKNEGREPILLWRTFADDMPPQSGEVKLEEVPSRGETG